MKKFNLVVKEKQGKSQISHAVRLQTIYWKKRGNASTVHVLRVEGRNLSTCANRVKFIYALITYYLLQALLSNAKDKTEEEIPRLRGIKRKRSR
jgi:hypothetical protein